MIKPNKGLLLGMIFCVVGGILTIGLWYFLGVDIPYKQPVSTIPPKKEISIIETSMNELKEMGLLDLIDLKEKIIEFKNIQTDFEIDISGILDVLF